MQLIHRNKSTLEIYDIFHVDAVAMFLRQALYEYYISS